MKKLWSTYSYTILLMIISCISAIFLGFTSDKNEQDYLKITINAGDTIWEMADQYSMDSNMSKKQFVNWVVSHNNIEEKHLYPGAELVLPIKDHSYENGTELASAIGD
ncbi:MAG TPA: LysM peptidoglycan-binding domain-containing protein [Pseudoneobacillus sp.]|nr:LysM peptidoglycan-binding domain-containing protein [Pseudoneobacillus sp.]